MKHIKVVMLAGEGNSSKIIYNALKNHYSFTTVILEEDVPRKIFIQRRIKNLGYLTVFGQILFMIFNKFLFKLSKKRIDELRKKYNLNTQSFPEDKILRVESINDNKVIDVLREEKPDVVMVNGTRIIKENILNSTDAIFLNTHMGITPKYRGVHGGYWALTQNDKDNCGVTVHVVDKGIDTGSILFQDTVSITKKDNFNTYPYHQIAKAIPLMKKAIKDAAEKKQKIIKNNLESKIWTHPTLFQYLKYFIFKSVK